MKKLVFIALGLVMLSCKNQGAKEGLKTAYVDTDKLVKKYQKAIDLENKYKVKSEEIGRELETEAKKFQKDYAHAEQQAPSKGPQWAQKKGMELQKREQELTVKQQSMYQELQKASGTEMDSLVAEIKVFLKEYGKKEGYDYLYGTGSAATVLFAKDQYDLTEKLTKLLNESYKPTEATKRPEKKEAKK